MWAWAALYGALCYSIGSAQMGTLYHRHLVFYRTRIWEFNAPTDHLAMNEVAPNASLDEFNVLRLLRVFLIWVFVAERMNKNIQLDTHDITVF